MIQNKPCLVFFCFGIVQLIRANTIGLEIELVQVVFRHGARTPNDCEAKLIPDFDVNKYDPPELAQLTNAGKMQEYSLGRMLRKRYNNFLTDKYSPEDVYAYSSAVPRTKESLQLVLAALYPPIGSLVWNRDLNWIPIATNYLPIQLDNLLKSRNCLRFKKELAELYNSTGIRNSLLEFEEEFKFLKSIYEDDFGPDKIMCSYNIIVVHKNLNVALPDWYSESGFVKMKKAAQFFLDTISYTSTLKKLNGGMLVKRFVENMNRSYEKISRRKIYLYSGHDDNLYSIAKTLDLKLDHLPDYGSAIILEKLRDTQNNHYVKVLLWSGEPKKIITARVGNCAEICPMREFLRNLELILPSDDESRCLLEDLDSSNLEKILESDFDQLG